jgi:hypothetical protein
MLMPVPETARLEIVIVLLPEFASLIVCVALLPTVTLPKLTDEGVIVSDEELPDPVQFAVSAVLEALVVTLSVPDSVALVVGLNVSVALALAPAANVEGTVNPDIVTPDPVTLAFEIVALPLPEFVIFTVCVAVAPSATLPKFTASVESSTPLVKPCPFSGIVVVASSAVLAIVTAPAEAPAAVALNATKTCPVCPADSVVGAAIPPTVNPLPVTEIFEIVTDFVPSFVTVTGCIQPLPTTIDPKLMLAGDTEIAAVPVPFPPPTAPLPVVPTQPDVIKVAANITIASELRIILPVENFPERCGVFVAVSRYVFASLITEAIVACGPEDALLYPGPQLVQVFTAGQQDRPVLSACFAG